ncbi:protocadherin-20-like [Pseudophryne corroboree]|uniref:protocadherin-20-like n=1 Tax=Pseudophryne corroboree TaxID=495146 RepID=UPI003081365F
MGYLQYYFSLLIITFQMLELPGATTEMIFHVREEQEEGTFVGNLRNGLISPTALKFTLLSHNIYFHLDAQSGNLYTTSNKLDRESICPFQTLDHCSMMLDVFISSQDYSEFTKVNLFILDINDNSPYFSEQTYHISISEDAIIGTKFPIDISAKDTDIEDNGVLSYLLISPDNIFTLDHQSELISLVVLKPLDRESQSEYRMTLLAVDRGLPPLSGSATLVVQVTDVNDNCPVFLSNIITISLPRNTSVGSPVVQLVAVDEDIGENSVIQYFYSNRVPKSTMQLFSLDSATGLITLSASLYEEITQYKFTVLAIGHGCLPVVATITINLEKIRKEPKMEFRFIASQNEGGVSIREDVPPGTIIAILEVTDPDYSIVRPLFINGTSPFLLKPSEGSPNTYLLSTSTELDFELKQQYDISIMGHSNVDESFVYREALRVTIEDVNDNFPKFSKDLVEIYVEENNKPGDVLLKLSASDEDSGSNGNISYYLVDGYPEVFSVDRSSGILKANVPFDREKEPIYSVWIVARDNGLPSNNDSCLVLINILDQNDNIPTFASKEFTFYIPENLLQRGEVGIINVTDADVGLNGDFSVFLINTTKLFSVDQDYILRSEGPFDYEKESMYELWVGARDKGSPPLSSKAKVLVYILDVNDNAPLIVLPESNFSYVLVSPDTSKGSSVTKVHAVDYDAGMNGVIRYSEFGEGSPNVDLFMIDTYTGNITLRESTSGHHCGLYQLLVKASDQGYPEALSTIVRVNILLNHSISNRSYLESLIMSKTTMTQENQVIVLGPCPQNRQSMASFSWPLTTPFTLAIVSICVVCCMTGTFLFLCLRRRNSKKVKSPVQIPLQLTDDYCAKDWDEVKYCKSSSERPLTL